MTPADRIAELEAELHQQREHIERLLSVNIALQARVQELEARLAKDSHNSTKPPSSDGLVRKTKSLRQKTGRKPGGHPGHPGHRVSLATTPDEIVLHRPARCGACQRALPDAAHRWIERRQVQDLPPVRLRVTEHQIVHVRCPDCGATTAPPPPAGGAAPRQYGPRPRAVAI